MYFRLFMKQISVAAMNLYMQLCMNIYMIIFFMPARYLGMHLAIDS